MEIFSQVQESNSVIIHKEEYVISLIILKKSPIPLTPTVIKATNLFKKKCSLKDTILSNLNNQPTI